METSKLPACEDFDRVYDAVSVVAVNHGHAGVVAECDQLLHEFNKVIADGDVHVLRRVCRTHAAKAMELCCDFSGDRYFSRDNPEHLAVEQLYEDLRAELIK